MHAAPAPAAYAPAAPASAAYAPGSALRASGSNYVTQDPPVQLQATSSRSQARPLDAVQRTRSRHHHPSEDVGAPHTAYDPAPGAQRTPRHAQPQASNSTHRVSFQTIPVASRPSATDRVDQRTQRGSYAEAQVSPTRPPRHERMLRSHVDQPVIGGPPFVQDPPASSRYAPSAPSRSAPFAPSAPSRSGPSAHPRPAPPTAPPTTQPAPAFVQGSSRGRAAGAPEGSRAQYDNRHPPLRNPA
ncbi:hypothetical protein EIP86_008429, partial [Pleurotus ostreatoroseus]